MYMKTFCDAFICSITKYWTRTELVKLVNPFLVRYPELSRAFKELLGQSEQPYSDSVSVSTVSGSRAKERIHGDVGLEVDFSTCKKMCASYRQLPRSYVPQQCSGRTALCREVLNDTYVSFPYSSEDSQNVSSKRISSRSSCTALKMNGTNWIWFSSSTL